MLKAFKQNREKKAWLGIGLVCALLPLGAWADQSLSAGLQAYHAGDLGWARNIAVNHLDQPRGRLVHALCLVHDTKNGDVGRGLEALEQLYRDSAVDRAVRLEAGLSYGRVIQLLQVRNLHPEFDDADAAAFYREYIVLAADSKHACLAVLNLAELYCDAWLLHKDPRLGQQALSLLEEFIDRYAGSEPDLVPLHLMAEALYQEIDEDYRKSYEHLDAAYRLGIMKLQVRRAALLKMGRLNHLKLECPALAIRYYRDFLREFPNARQTPHVRRYLAELTAEDR